MLGSAAEAPMKPARLCSAGMQSRCKDLLLMGRLLTRPLPLTLNRALGWALAGALLAAPTAAPAHSLSLDELPRHAVPPPETGPVLDVQVEHWRREALALEHGDGVERDPLRAAELYCRAARYGDAEAQFNLAWMLTNGRGIQRDDAQAAHLFAAAAEQGVRQAQNMRFTSNGAEYAVELRALLPQVDSTTRTREARLRFVDAVADPGTAGRLVWQGQGRLLPAIYLVRRNGVLGVFVREQDTARFVALPDAQDGRPAAITLAADTLLIDDGRQRLNDGDAVRSVDTE